jgi:hypothetical protein
MGLPCQYGTRPEAYNTRNKKLNEVSPLAARFQKVPSCIIATTGSNFISVREILHEGKQKITVEWEKVQKKLRVMFLGRVGFQSRISLQCLKNTARGQSQN